MVSSGKIFALMLAIALLIFNMSTHVNLALASEINRHQATSLGPPVWVEMATSSGHAPDGYIKDSDKGFSVNHSEWRIRWTVTPDFQGDGAPFYFNIRPIHSRYDQVGEISGKAYGEPLSGTLVVRNSQNRSFYFDITALFFISWDFIIEENINSPLLDNEPPEILVLSPQNITYASENISLTFTINEAVQIWYSLDGYDSRTQILGNTTLEELEDGFHSLTLYAEDQLYNTAISEPIYFTVSHKTAADEFFLTILALTILAMFASISIILVVYLIKKRKVGNPITNK